MWIKVVGPRFIHVPDGAEIKHRTHNEGFVVLVEGSRVVDLVYVPADENSKSLARVFAILGRGVEGKDDIVDLQEFSEPIRPRRMKIV